MTPTSRRTRLVVAGVVLALVALVTAAAPGGSAVAAGPLVWGADVRKSGSQTQLQAVQALQTAVGRNLRGIRDFLSWDSPFPTDFENGLKAQGTTVLLSVSTRTVSGTAVLWSNIAAAQPGSALYTAMKSWADRVRDFGAPIYVTLQHEPETSKNLAEGTAPDYLAAWQKWVSVFRAEGATNAKYLWIATANAFRVKTTDRRYGPKWYPGDASVDGIAVDAYNYYTCRTGINTPWRSLQWLIENSRQFVLQHPGKEAWVTEYGSVADPADASRRAQWITDARNLFKQVGYEQYVGVLYFDINGTCLTKIDGDSQAMSAFSAMGADPYYAG